MIFPWFSYDFHMLRATCMPYEWAEGCSHFVSVRDPFKRHTTESPHGNHVIRFFCFFLQSNTQIHKYTYTHIHKDRPSPKLRVGIDYVSPMGECQKCALPPEVTRACPFIDAQQSVNAGSATCRWRAASCTDFSTYRRPIIGKRRKDNLPPDGGKLHRLVHSSMPKYAQ